jgi:hypothetical protein
MHKIWVFVCDRCGNIKSAKYPSTQRLICDECAGNHEMRLTNTEMINQLTDY